MRKLTIAAGLMAAAAAAPVFAAPVVWGGNGHAYEFISSGTDWFSARAAAQTMSYNGQQGYLVTITSADEQAFIYGSVTTTTAWAGGSDAASEGTTEGNWIWVDGPEAGSAFTYTNWSGGEPNNCCGGENYLHINWSGSGWNDIPYNYANYGYVVEFGGLGGGVPEPSAWALLILGFGAVGGALRRTRKTRVSLRYA